MTIDLADAQLDALLKRLRLASSRCAWQELTRRAEQEAWSYRDFLALLVSEEIVHRQQPRIARMAQNFVQRDETPYVCRTTYTLLKRKPRDCGS